MRLDQRFPPGRGLHRAMGVLAVGQPLHRRIAGHVGKHELAGEAEQLADDPGQVVLRAVLQHVGADDAVELALRQCG